MGKERKRERERQTDKFYHKTKLQIIFINQSLEKKSILITTHGCVAK